MKMQKRNSESCQLGTAMADVVWGYLKGEFTDHHGPSDHRKAFCGKPERPGNRSSSAKRPCA